MTGAQVTEAAAVAGGRGEDNNGELGKEDPLRSLRQKAQANPAGGRRGSWMLLQLQRAHLKPALLRLFLGLGVPRSSLF